MAKSIACVIKSIKLKEILIHCFTNNQDFLFL